MNANMTMTENMFSSSKKSSPGKNNQWQFGSSGKLAPILPALNTTRSSHGHQKFFFATKQGSDSIGEMMEDPRKARRLKINQVAKREGTPKNDNALGTLLYGTQVNTQKNLVTVRTIRQSLKDQLLNESITNDGESASKFPPVISKHQNAAQLRMNRTSVAGGV